MNVSVAAASTAKMRRRRLSWPLLGTILLGVLTTIPYLYAAWTTPPDRVYTGLMLDAPDTLQYFSWMRDHRSALLVPNRMTSQPNDPALFNLLWLTLAQIQNVTGWSNAAIFQLLRLVAGSTFLAILWWFYRLTARSRHEQRWAWTIAAFGGGLGIVWVIEKYARGLPDVRYPFDVYVAEPNTLLNLLSYPHFLAAAALIVGIFGAAIQAERGDWRWWWLASGLGLLLALQHAYDLLTVYGVLGGWIALLALKERRIPWRTVGGATLLGIVSFPPAGYFAWLTSRDPLWRAVLNQFTNAGVWTPNPLHLPILIGLPLVLAIVGLISMGSLRTRSDGELLIVTWAIVGAGLIYLPVNFQIHLLNPWQVPLALLAVWGINRRIVPLVARYRRGAARWVLPVLVVLMLPTNLYLLAWRIVELRRYDAPYYLRADQAAALAWLGATTNRSDVVLSSLNLGQFVAAETDARAVLAHWAQTVDFYRTQADVARALDPATPAIERRAVLQRYGVSFVLAEQSLNDPLLKPAWQRSSAMIYRVKLER